MVELIDRLFQNFLFYNVVLLAYEHIVGIELQPLDLDGSFWKNYHFDILNGNLNIVIVIAIYPTILLRYV